MPIVAETITALTAASPTVLALLLGLAAVCVAGLALYVAYRALSRD